MKFSLTKAALAALISLGSIAAMPAAASARDSGGFYFGFSTDGGRHHYRDYGVRDHGYRSERRYGRGQCSERRALRKAYRMGLDRVRVVRETPRKIVVKGRTRHHREFIVFANERGCPIIS